MRFVLALLIGFVWCGTLQQPAHAQSGQAADPGSRSGDPAASSASQQPTNRTHPSGSGTSGSGGKDDNGDGGADKMGQGTGTLNPSPTVTKRTNEPKTQ